jgi:hypothetical protein
VSGARFTLGALLRESLFVVFIDAYHAKMQNEGDQKIKDISINLHSFRCKFRWLQIKKSLNSGLYKARRAKGVLGRHFAGSGYKRTEEKTHFHHE